MPDRSVDIKIRLTEDAATNARVINQVRNQITQALGQTQVKTINPFGISEAQIAQLGARLTTISAQTHGKLQQIAASAAAQQSAITQTGASRIVQIQVAAHSLQLTNQQAFQQRVQLSAQQHQQRLNEIAAREAARRDRPDATGAGAAAALSAVGAALGGAAIVSGARQAVDSAVGFDRSVNVLRAFTGGLEQAEQRLAKLIATAKQTPGLTTALATQLDVQLRVAGATEQAINRLLPAIGRLNAASPLGDPQRFAQNLVQLVTQNFEKIDLKELVGQSPLAGEIIKQLFNVDSAINGEAIRASAQKLGLTSVDAFFTAFANAAANNPKLAQIGESLGTQFDKLKDRVTVALRPLGLVIIGTISPAIEVLVSLVERLSTRFASLPPSIQTALVVLGALVPIAATLAAGLGALVFAIGSVITAWGTLSTVLAGPALAGALASLATAGPIIAIVAGAIGIATIAWLNYESASEKAAAITTDVLQGQLKAAQSSQVLQSAALQITQAQAGSTEQHSRLNDVLGQLDPATRTYIKAITDQQQQVRELTRAVSDLADANQSRFGASLRVIAQAAREQQGAIEGSNDAIKKGQNFINLLVREAERYPQQAREFRDQATGISKDILEQSAASDKAKDSLRELGAKLAGLVDREFKGSRDAFIEQAQTMRLGQTEITALVSALDAYRASQAGAQAATDNTTGSVKNQVGSVQQLTAALKDLNFEALKTGVSARIKEIVAQASAGAKRALTSQEVAAIVKQQERLDPTFSAGLQQSRIAETNSGLINSALFPSARAGSAAARQIDQIAEKLQDFRDQLTRKENASQIERALLFLRDTFAKGLTAVDTTVETILAKVPPRFRAVASQIITAAQSLDLQKVSEKALGLEQIIKLAAPVAFAGVTGVSAAAAAITGEAQIGALIEKRLAVTREISVVEQVSNEILRQQGNGVAFTVEKLNEMKAAAQAADDVLSARKAEATFKALNEQLDQTIASFQKLTEAQKIQQAAGFGQLSGADKDKLITKAARVDALNAFKEQEEQAQRTAERISGFFERTFSDAFQRGPRAFLDNLKRLFFDTSAQISARLATSLLFKFLGGQSPALGALGGGSGVFQPGASGGGGGILGGIFGGGGSSGGGGLLGGLLGPGGTAPFNPGASGGAGGLLSRIPFLGNLFGSGSAASGAALPTSNFNPLSVFLNQGSGAASQAGGAAAQSAFSLSSLAGPIALASILGGNLIAGKVTGFGNVLKNFGVVGGLLARLFFKDKTLGSLRGLIQGEYGLQVKDNSILEQIKQIGQQAFGKEFPKHQVETIRLQQVKDILAQYAEATGQQSSKLFGLSQLTNPFASVNQFVRRISGGLIPGPTLGRDHVAAFLDGGEVVSRSQTVRREGFGKFNALDAGQASITTNGDIGAMVAELKALRSEVATMQREQVAAVKENSRVMSVFRTASPNDVVTRADNDAVTRKVRGSLNGSTSEGVGLRDHLLLGTS